MSQIYVTFMAHKLRSKAKTCTFITEYSPAAINIEAIYFIEIEHFSVIIDLESSVQIKHLRVIFSQALYNFTNSLFVGFVLNCLIFSHLLPFHKV